MAAILSLIQLPRLVAEVEHLITSLEQTAGQGVVRKVTTTPLELELAGKETRAAFRRVAATVSVEAVAQAQLEVTAHLLEHPALVDQEVRLR